MSKRFPSVPSEEFLLYQTEDGRRRVETRIKEETVWLTQEQMAQLFDKAKSTINEHIKNIFEERELVEEDVMRKFGISEFSTKPTLVETGDNYQDGRGIRSESLLAGVPWGQDIHINIFNISKINSEMRGGKSPKIKRLSDYIGESYFDYLAGLDDLVMLMDESHRYRESAGV